MLPPGVVVDTLQLTAVVCTASVITRVPALDTLERSLHKVSGVQGWGERFTTGDMPDPDQPTAMRCCWPCTSLVGGPATECPVCHGRSFLRLYTAPFTGRGCGDMSCLPDAVGRLALSLPASMATLFWRRLQLWVQGVRTAYTHSVDRSHAEVCP